MHPEVCRVWSCECNPSRNFRTTFWNLPVGIPLSDETI